MKTSILLVVGALWFTQAADATVIWMGGEDVDFPNGANVCVNTWSGAFRSYARESITPCACGSIAVSTPFSGGAVTTAWLSAQIYFPAEWPHWWMYYFIGLGNTAGASSLWVGMDSTNAQQLALWKFDGTTWTELAAEGGTSLSSNGQYKIDMSVTGYGASATVNVYFNGGNPKITYTGNVLAGSATDLNAVVMYNYDCNGNNGYWPWFSEVIVSTTDTRALSLATLAPAAAGDTNQWSGSYSNVNPTTINDAVNVSDATSGDIFECKLNSLPSGIGNVSVAGVKVLARGTKSGGGVASMAVGVKTNASVSTPAAVAQTGSYFPTETYYSTNPVTSVAWTAVDLNALQITLKSAP